MLVRMLLALLIATAAITTAKADAAPGVVAIDHTYEVRIRLNGRVSTVRVQASSAGHAKQLVQAQYGDKVTVLGTKKVD